jgi:hypothetical protein
VSQRSSASRRGRSWPAPPPCRPRRRRAFLPVDLDADEPAFIAAAVASSSNDSCAITWHQWQAAYPTESRIGHVTASRLGERLVTPLEPVDGVVGVLAQVGRGRGGQGVVLDAVATAALLVWAVDEVLRGVNPFRRLLGGGVLVVVVAGLVVR